MTSLLLLLLLTAMVQVLLLPSVVGAATGAFQDKAGDFAICKAESCNNIKLKNKTKQKKICKEKKEVRSSCPQMCDDVSVFKKCPKKITSNNFEKDCSDKYQDNLQCDYDYKYTGCDWDELQCTSQQGYTCDYELSKWNLATTNIQECDNPPNGLPVHETCVPCPDVSAEGCPKKRPTYQENCNNFEIGLKCNYNFKLTGCTPNELQCSPQTFFTCEPDPEYSGKKWVEEYVDIPPQICPSSTCSNPKPNPSSDLCKPWFKDGLECKYDFIFTGCKLDELRCSSQQTYSCEYDSDLYTLWSLQMTPLLYCNDPLPIDLPVSQQCTWPEALNMPYEEAERIILASDTVGFLTNIEMVVKGTVVTEEY